MPTTSFSRVLCHRKYSWRWESTIIFYTYDVMCCALWHHLSSLPYQFSIFEDVGVDNPVIILLKNCCRYYCLLQVITRWMWSWWQVKWVDLLNQIDAKHQKNLLVSQAMNQDSQAKRVKNAARMSVKCFMLLVLRKDLTRLVLYK